MTEAVIKAVKNLKERYQTLPKKERENLSVALLKCNLGVSTTEETAAVKLFLADFPLTLVAGELDDFLSFLHAKDTSLPQHLPLSGGVVTLPPYENADVDTLETSRNTLRGESLPSYNEEEVDTLRDPLKPFKE
jgi:hypothetical protein